jgi:hypothetical protein
MFVDARLVFDHESDKKPRDKNGLYVIHIPLKIPCKGNNGAGPDFACEVAGQYYRDIEQGHEETFPSLKEEEVEHNTEAEVACHAAVNAAACKIDGGKKNFAEAYKGNPYPDAEEQEFIAEPEGNDDNQYHCRHYHYRQQRYAFNDPGDGRRHTAGDAECQNEVENTAVKGKFFRKYVPENKFSQISYHDRTDKLNRIAG